MDYILEDYIKDVKLQLCCNNDLGKADYITYNYTEEEIDKNIKYFEHQFHQELSAYKALLFFSDYLEGDYRIESYTIVTQPEIKHYEQISTSRTTN